uniref:Ribosomal protein S4 X-linked n=1 Tax=Anas platyrhynchos TaxID=8839 RepID=A0A8B9SI41_ANAPL
PLTAVFLLLSLKSDVISIEKTGEHFRLVYDTKGRFAVHRITAEEAKYKLCKVRKIFVGTKGIPHLVTHDARTIRYPDPLIKVNDTIQIDLETGKITDFIKFDTGNLCMVTGGANLGRIGVITNRERHPGSFDVVHVKDANGNSFATRLSNIFVIGKVSEHGLEWRCVGPLLVLGGCGLKLCCCGSGSFRLTTSGLGKHK